MPAAEDQQPVEALSTEAPDPALGVRSRPRRSDGRLDHADAFGAEDLVEVAAELAVAVTDQEPRLDALVVEVHEQVARLLGHPRPVRIRRDPCQMHAASRQLDEEQDVEPPEEDGVDCEEVALEDARRLLTKELRPTRLKPPGRRFDPRLAQDRPHCARRDLDAEPDQLALDAPVPPARVLPRKPNDKLTNLARRRGPARRHGYVQRRATSSRCQRRSVAGVTKNAAHARRGRTRLNAASTARSA